jgi:hypothetical protein
MCTNVMWIDLGDNLIGYDTVLSIRVGVPCPSAATPEPTRVTAVATSPTTIRLSWLAPTTAIPTGYAVWEGERLKTIVRGTTVSHTFLGLQPGSTHCFYVYAFYQAGSSSIEGIVCATTPRS